jgi:hypothetical protein
MDDIEIKNIEISHQKSILPFQASFKKLIMYNSLLFGIGLLQD